MFFSFSTVKDAILPKPKKQLISDSGVRCTIVTDCFATDSSNYIVQLINDCPDLLLAKEIVKPRGLYQLLESNFDKQILIRQDLLSKRREYIQLLEGAICFNPYTKQPWRVQYAEDSFEFKGKLILLSAFQAEALKKRPKLEYLIRDSLII